MQCPLQLGSRLTLGRWLFSSYASFLTHNMEIAHPSFTVHAKQIKRVTALGVALRVAVVLVPSGRRWPWVLAPLACVSMRTFLLDVRWLRLLLLTRCAPSVFREVATEAA